ncbi:hypothetical protein PAXRUDRAFT_44059, partial [Paxillus rubicundulus Ve08.2h10]
IARVQRSNRQHQQADWNRDYQQTNLQRKLQKLQNSQEHLQCPQNPLRTSSLPDADHRKSAIEEELLNLNSNHVYETVPIPEGVTPITSRPVFCIKRDHTRNVECYKARIV